MVGKELPPKLITEQEAVELNRFSTTEEIYRAQALYQAFRIACPIQSNDRQWEFMKMIAFIYGAGRLQGIREERAKRKAKRSV